MKFILIYYKLEILTCWASDESLPESFTTIVELGVIGMIVELTGLVTDGSAKDAIPPTRGFENLSFLYAS